MPRITLLPSQTVVDAVAGTSVFQAARESGIMVDTACGGKGTCGLCRVKIINGLEHLSEPSFEEKRFTGSASSLRLSCRICPTGDVTVEVPPPRPPRAPKRK